MLCYTFVMETYNDKYILYKIIDYKFTLTDLNSKIFPQLREGAPLYCPFHENTHTGTMQARIYFNEEKNIWYLHCYAEGANYYAHDYVERIMVAEKQLFPNIKSFIFSKMNKEEFISLYNMFKAQKQEYAESAYQRKCDWINNIYFETGNVVDYIEALYTA